MSTLRAFTMPKWGIEMSEGTINEWNVQEGDAVVKGQALAQIETDKIVNEVVAEFDARFVRVIAAVGDTHPVGALLGVMAAEAVTAEQIDEFVREFRRSRGAASSAHDVATATPADAAAPAVQDATTHSPAGDRTAPRAGAAARSSAAASASPALHDGRLMSPAARELAARRGVAVTDIRGSGRAGRITFQDIDQAAKRARAVGGGAAVSIMPAVAAFEAVYASPYATRLAAQHAVDLATLPGTGPRGRISRQDVLRAAGITVPVRAAVDVVRMTPMRKAIARQLTLSKSTIPHFYLRVDIVMDALLARRAELKGASGSAPTVNDFLIRATALALMQTPEVNIQVHGEDIHRFRNAEIAVAVATDRGLFTPVLRRAEAKSVAEISMELRGLIDRARGGKLRAEEIEGGSFTVSNLGMLGVQQFDAIINPPQGAILAIGAARRCALEIDSGLRFGNVACFSLSCDHRAIDGAVGAKFLAALKQLIESPRQL